MKVVQIWLILAFGLLAGCTGAEWNTVNWGFNPTKGDSRLVDAKQRAIISVRRPELGPGGEPIIYDNGYYKKAVTSLVVCVEPSPDALQATATALAAGGSSESLDAAFRLAFSNSDTAASIGLRTQSIQLLRDAYYRLCEAYLNDGLDSIAYDVMQRRFQNQITALLAIEQLTGTVKAGQVALNTTASSDAGANAALLERQLEKARKRETKLRADLATAKKRMTDLENKKLKLETDIPKTKAELEVEKAKIADGNPLKPEEVTAVKKNITRLENTLSKQEKELDPIQGLIDIEEGTIIQTENSIASNQTLITSLDASFRAAAQKTITAGTTGTATIGPGTTSNPKHEEAVVNAVRAITLNAINQDYEAQVCFEALRFRNHVTQYKNFNAIREKALEALVSRGNDSEISTYSRQAFVRFCDNIFQSDIKLRKAQADAVISKSTQLERIINAATTGGTNKLNALEAVNLILALDQATPLDPTVGYLKRKTEFGKKLADGTEEGPSVGTKMIVPSTQTLSLPQ